MGYPFKFSKSIESPCRQIKFENGLLIANHKLGVRLFSKQNHLPHITFGTSLDKNFHVYERMAFHVHTMDDQNFKPKPKRIFFSSKLLQQPEESFRNYTECILVFLINSKFRAGLSVCPSIIKVLLAGKIKLSNSNLAERLVILTCRFVRKIA